jgi:molybdopterin synthase catalytic subunit
LTAIEVRLVDGPLAPPAPWRPAGSGAVVVFEGIVRPREAERPLAALIYEAYEPMSSRELGRLAREVAERHGVLAVDLEHSRGRVPAGALSFRLRVAATHRKSAIGALDELIDRMKQGVPLWKVPEWPDGSRGEQK